MIAFDISHRYLAWMRRKHAEIRTRRLLDSLPKEIRRDIGWPDGYIADRFGSSKER